jgi:hypothetical protein
MIAMRLIVLAYRDVAENIASITYSLPGAKTIGAG